MKLNEDYIFEPWYAKLTDSQIKSCQGDYYGCEICRNKKRCASLQIEELNKALKEITNEIQT